MGLKFENLDRKTRGYMLEEIELDAQKDALYLSPWLTQKGQGDWADLLRDAATSGSDVTLGRSLRENRLINAMAMRRKPGGHGYATYRVPYTAHETMAEGEFNRFYVRGLCRRALTEGIERLEVYRAKEVSEPRPESWDKIGNLMTRKRSSSTFALAQALRLLLGCRKGRIPV